MLDMAENTIQEQLKLLQEDLIAKFQDLKNDNEKFRLRLEKIEVKLGITAETTNEELLIKELEDVKGEKQSVVQNDFQKEENAEDLPSYDEGPEDNIVNNESNDDDEDINDDDEDINDEDEDNASEPQEGGKPEVKLDALPSSVFQGFCFRPLAGWRNSQGKLEISKEWVTVSEEEIELKICGFESSEEIARINIPLKDVEKVEASFEEKTVLFLFVERDICEAATQSLAMTNISSFSLIDKDSKKIRICFEKISDQRKALLREYFRRSAIFFKYIFQMSQDRIFFKPISKPLPPKYDSNKPLPLEDFVKTVKTIKFLDRVTYTCKVCKFYNEKKDVVIRHVNKYHIEKRNSISDKDILVKFVKCSS